jgi:rod shape-determining protein MreC
MRHLPAEPPAFFHRGPSPLARLAFFGLLSVLLLFADTRYRYLETLRQVAAVVLYPLQQAALVPGALLAQVGTYFVTQRTLADENAVLRRRLVEQGAAAQAFASERHENDHLRALLDARESMPPGTATVEVLYSGRDPFSQKLFVGIGPDAAVRPGAAVIDADGVVGQVTRVYPHMAEVTLITDKDHAVPVKVERSGVRSVLFGAGTGHQPQLRFMSPNADVEVGDTLVTSGIDGTYPPGLAVAKVASLERNTGQMFARISAQPLAGVDRSRHLLVLAEAASVVPRPEEPVDAEASRRPGRGKVRRP